MTKKEELAAFTAVRPAALEPHPEPRRDRVAREAVLDLRVVIDEDLHVGTGLLGDTDADEPGIGPEAVAHHREAAAGGDREGSPHLGAVVEELALPDRMGLGHQHTVGPGVDPGRGART